MWLWRFIQKTWGPSHEWDWHQIRPRQQVIGVDGTVLSGVVMRRKIRGQFQYRHPTDEEHAREAERQAITF